jgi:hypothetical protein
MPSLKALSVMSSCPTLSELRGLLGEGLTTLQRESIREHVRDCATCERLLAEETALLTRDRGESTPTDF